MAKLKDHTKFRVPTPGEAVHIARSLGLQRLQPRNGCGHLRDLFLPLAPQTLRILRRYLDKERLAHGAEHPELFLRARCPSGPIERWAIGDIFKKRVREAGIELPGTIEVSGTVESHSSPSAAPTANTFGEMPDATSVSIENLSSRYVAGVAYTRRPAFR